MCGSSNQRTKCFQEVSLCAPSSFTTGNATKVYGSTERSFRYKRNMELIVSRWVQKVHVLVTGEHKIMIIYVVKEYTVNFKVGNRVQRYFSGRNGDSFSIILKVDLFRNLSYQQQKIDRKYNFLPTKNPKCILSQIDNFFLKFYLMFCVKKFNFFSKYLGYNKLF